MGKKVVQGIKSWKRLSCSWFLCGWAALKYQEMFLPHHVSSKLLKSPLHILHFNPCAPYPRLFIHMGMFQMSHQNQDWFITWCFSKWNLFCFIKTKQNKRASKQKKQNQTKKRKEETKVCILAHGGNRNIMNIFSVISVFLGWRKSAVRII